MKSQLKEGFYVEKNLRRSSSVSLCYVTRKGDELVALFPESGSQEKGSYLPIVEGAGLDRSIGLDPTLLKPTDPLEYLKEHYQHIVQFIADRIAESQLEKAANHK